MPAPRPEAVDPCRLRSCLEHTPEGHPTRIRAVIAIPIASKRTSLWLDTRPRAGFPRLDRPLSVDVAVLGGGIVGISTALLLEARRHDRRRRRGRSRRRGRDGPHDGEAQLAARADLREALVELRRRRRARLRRGEPGRDRAGRAVGRGGGDRVRLPAQAELHVRHLARRPRATSRGRSRRHSGPGCRPPTPRRPTCPTRSPARCGSRTRPSSIRAGSCSRWPALIPGDGSHVFERTRATGVSEGRPCRVEHDRGDAHRRPRGRRDALPDPRPRPLLRTHPSRALIRARRTRARTRRRRACTSRRTSRRARSAATRSTTARS